MPWLFHASSAVARAVLATLAGMALFFWMIFFTVFVIPAALLCMAVLGALLIASCFALVFWMFTRDPNALRAFWMFSLTGAAPFGVFALMRHIFVAIIRARGRRGADVHRLPVESRLVGDERENPKLHGLKKFVCFLLVDEGVLEAGLDKLQHLPAAETAR